MKSALRKKSFQPGAKGALDGVRILDMSRLVAGNMLTQVLGDFGAEVIKIEPPAGDTLRAWQTDGVATNWKIYARNKKSLGLELRKPEAREILLKLLPSAAVFVEASARARSKKWGSARTCCSRKSQARHRAHFRLGPDRPLQAAAGFRHTGRRHVGLCRDQRLCRPRAGAAADVPGGLFAGLYGSTAVMIALREVEMNGGKGQVIDLPLLDPVFAVLGPQAANYRLTGQLKPRTGSRSTNSCPRNVYRCKDGKYVGAVGVDPEDGRAAVPPDRPRRLDRQPALQDQRRARKARRGTRCDHRRVRRATHAGRERRVL